MLLTLGKRRGLRRAGAIVAGLLLAASTLAGTASAAVWYVEFTPLLQTQTHTVMALGSADYSTSVGNFSATGHWFKVTGISDPTLSAAFTSDGGCVRIAALSNKDLSVRVTTTIPGTYDFHLTVHDYTNSACTNTNWSTGSATSITQAQIVVTQIPQTLSWTSTAPVGAVVGGSYTAAATSSAGLTPVDLSIDAASTVGACSIDGSGLVSFTGVGHCIVDADQLGDATHSAAAQVQQPFDIGLNSQTIAFDAAPTGATVGAAGVTVHATATSSLAVAYSSTTPLICAVDVATGALTLLAVGTCNIAADQAGNGTYAAAPQVTQDVAVGVAPVPQLSLVGAAVQPNFTKAGDIIDYTFTLANAGNVPLDGPFTVTSDKIASVVCPATPSGLAVGASIVCTGNYAVVLADMDAGKVVITATGQGFSGQTPLATAASVVTVQKVQIESVGAATSVPSQAVTPPPTNTSGNSPSNSSTPLFALLICFAFGALGLLAVQAQRQTLRR